MTSSQAKSPEASEQLARSATHALVGALVAGIVLLVGCGKSSPVVSPRGMSYGVEGLGRPFTALSLVDAARGTSRQAHDALLEGVPDAASTMPSGSPIVIVGLPRGDGFALLDDRDLVRDASLVVIEAFVDELRRQGLDVRLDRQSTLALPPRDVVPTLRLSLWLGTIAVRRGSAHVDASVRLHVWARGSAGEARWDEDHSLRARVDRPPFDVFSALGQRAAKALVPRLPPPPSAVAREEPRR